MIWDENRMRMMHRLHRQFTKEHTRGWRKLMSQLLGVRETQLIAKLGRAYQAKQLKPIYTGHAWNPPKPKPPPAPKPAPALITVRPVSAKLPVQPVSVRTCQFPMWPHNTRAPKEPCYCGNRVDEGSSWCALHRKQVYTPLKPRDRDRKDEFILNHLG